jgi:hypothetical protein
MRGTINSVAAFLRANWYLLSGRLRFPRDRVGEVVRMADGRDFTVFREGRVEPGSGHPERPGATSSPPAPVLRYSERLRN